MLFRAAHSAARPGDVIVCLGTPTVYQEAIQQGADRRVALVDANAAVVEHFARLGRWPRVWRVDLLHDPIPRLHSSVVVADPPWYWDELLAFVWSSSQICTLGGHVFLPLPPRGTRPGVVSEVQRLLDVARVMGFSVGGLDEGAVQYDSPWFEQNALRAAGIHLASYDWRRADLCVLRKVATNVMPRPAVIRRGGVWVEEELFGTRIKLRRKVAGRFTDPTLATLVTRDVLPSGSRRNPVRKSVDVWTSGNRVFSCTGTPILLTILRAMIRGQDPALRVAFALGRGLSDGEKRLIHVATEQLENLGEEERYDLCHAG
jgi:hypothetical protein